MSYEARCILQFMKDKLSSTRTPSRQDWLELANLIAAGELIREVKYTLREKRYGTP